MALDHDMFGQIIDFHILVLLVQIDAQLVPQRRQVPGDLAHGSQVEVAAALVVGVDGEVFAGASRDVVAWGRQRDAC